jgi:hypothetical protein
MVQAAADEAWRKARRGIDTGFGMAVGWVKGAVDDLWIEERKG